MASQKPAQVVDPVVVEHGEPTPQPLSRTQYASALAALAAGTLSGSAPRARAVRRSAELDEVSEAEMGTLATAAPNPGGRRAPIGTAHG